MAYYIDKIIVSETTRKKYLQIRIATACCKRRYLVEILPDGNYLDIEKGTNVPRGAKHSITLLYEWWKSDGNNTR